MRLGIGLGICGRSGGGAVFTPAALYQSGEQGAWYAPHDPSTLFQDSAGTVPVTADGQPVGRMLDLSGNGNHATQATTSLKPIYRTSGGLHWLEFDGWDDIIVGPTNLPVRENFYVGGAFRIDVGANIGTRLFGTGNVTGAVSTSAGALGVYQRSDGVFRQVIAAMRVGAGSPFTANQAGAFTLGTPFLGEAFHSADTLTASNASLETSVAADDNATDTRQISLGNAGPGYAFYGGVFRMASLADKSDIRAYLASKAGITL